MNINESQFFDNMNDSVLDPDGYVMAKPSSDNLNAMDFRNKDIRSLKSIDDASSYDGYQG